MSLTDFDVREEYTGTGTLNTYTFDFKIAELTDLLVIVMNASFVETFRVRGDDVTDLSSVTFDPVNGGGTVVLDVDLPLNHKLIFLLSNDDPKQESEYRGKGPFRLEQFEASLDVLGGQIQRLAYLVARSLKITDRMSTADAAQFDTQLPTNSITPATEDNSGRLLAIGNDNKSLQLGPTIASLSISTGIIVKYAVGFADLSAAALTNNIELFELEEKEFIEWVLIKHTTAFTGGAISAYRVCVGISSDLDKYQPNFNVFQAVGDQVFDRTVHGGSVENFGNSTSIKIKATSVGANLSAATAGSVDVYVKKGLLP